MRFSVNQHGAKLGRCDYIVAMDNIPDLVLDLGPPVIGFYPWADYRLIRFWDAGNSGIQAVWCAYQMGCSPILIAGADCYQGGTYWHDPDAKSSGHNSKLHEHLSKWRRLKDAIDIRGVRAIGGPLVSVFGEWSAHEMIEAPPEIDRSYLMGIRVECIRSFAVSGVHYEAGTEASFTESAARQLANMGRVKILPKEPPQKPSPKPFKKAGRPRKAG